jgi:hypothetical protein
MLGPVLFTRIFQAYSVAVRPEKKLIYYRGQAEPKFTKKTLVSQGLVANQFSPDPGHGFCLILLRRSEGYIRHRFFEKRTEKF